MDSANIARIFKVLANKTRLLIFEAIAGNKEMNSSTIVTLRGVTAATVSHHLNIPSHTGLIECRRQGQFVHHRAVPEMIENYRRELSRLSRLKKRSDLDEALTRSPQPKRPEYASGSLRVSRHLLRKSSTTPIRLPNSRLQGCGSKK